MRPQKLVMSAFGSYAEEEIIDFSQIDGGVFLITGDTGAGKTTVFDAITYALFDRTSGGKRDGMMMRSQYAGPQTPTFVEFTFSYQGEIYCVRRNPSYIRQSKRKNKEGERTFTTQEASVSLTMPDGREYPGRIKEINEKIVEILGVGKEQFVQVAMIAQGEFLRLLHASSRERKEIFGRIFDTGIYERLQKSLREKGKTLYGKLEDNRKLCLHEIEGVQCTNDSAFFNQWQECRERMETNFGQIQVVLAQMIEEQVGQETDLRERETGLMKRQEELNYKLRQTEEINRLFAQAQNAEKEIREREQQLEELGNRQEECQMICAEMDERINRQMPVLMEELAELKGMMPKYARLQEIRQAVEDAGQKRQSAEQKLRRQQEELADTESEIQRLENAVEKLQAETLELPELVQQEKHLTEKRSLLIEMKQTCQRWEESKEAHRKGQEKIRGLSHAYQEKSREHDAKYQRFIEEQAGFLAQELREGEPCPVCGSFNHPQKAAFSGEAVTRQELDEAKQARDLADRKLQEYRQQFQKIQEEYERQMALLMRDGQRMFGAKFEVPMIEPALSETEAACGEVSQSLEKCQKKTQQLKERQEKLEKDRKRVLTVREQLEQWKEELFQATLAYEKAEQAGKDLQAQLSYESEEEAKIRLAKREKQKQELEAKKDKAERELRIVREQSAAQRAALEEQRKNCRLLAQQMEGKEPAETAKLIEDAEKFKQQAQVLEEEKRRLFTVTERNREAKKNLTVLQKERESLKEQYELVGNLERTANGNLAGQARIDLQTYVQRRYFKYMIGEANRRLVRMNGETFMLQCREFQNLGKQGEVGLDLDVYDLVTDKVRDVKTLSGGESFLAALSMALGMADVIGKTAGRVHIDTMFIDEGFGSLDEEARNRAIGILNELAGETRLVGIISHVSELKEQMDRKLVVSRSDRGSRARWVIDS